MYKSALLPKLPTKKKVFAFRKILLKAKFCFSFALSYFFYFAKMQDKFIYKRISAKFKSIFACAQRLCPFAEM
jgi:hypothetical protein